MIPQFPNDSEHEIPEYTDAELAQMLAETAVEWKRRNAAGQPTPEKPVTVGSSQPLAPDLPR
jgi:hypothetical protein